MSFATLAVISLVAIVGPLLAWPRRWHLPVILGELAAGIVLGATGGGRLQADNETFTFLADIGFVLIMFVVGAQVPVRDHRLRAARHCCIEPECAGEAQQSGGSPSWKGAKKRSNHSTVPMICRF
jgi:Kef-type K+ transport system membrane component KefB